MRLLNIESPLVLRALLSIAPAALCNDQDHHGTY